MTGRVLWRLVTINLNETLQYRGSFVIYMFSIVAGSIISLLVWLAVLDQGVRLPMDRQSLVTYYVLLGIVTMLTSSWICEFLAEKIRLGLLSPILLRPAPEISNAIGNNLGEKIVKLVFLLPMVGLTALIFRDDLLLPTDPIAWALFAVALPLAAATAFLIDYLIGSLAFWVEDVRGLSRVRTLVGAFLSGQIVPLALFPEWLVPYLRVQPFRYTLSFPLEVLTGRLTAGEITLGFALQIGYCLVLWGAYRLAWHYGLRSYSASGA
ncbi:MAG TPA: ABC-2 family transporter protein [Chloroflexota bacterium]|nr:ABC-2 family transporter protein [Chloroflexota bacterium]